VVTAVKSAIRREEDFPPDHFFAAIVLFGIVGAGGIGVPRGAKLHATGAFDGDEGILIRLVNRPWFSAGIIAALAVGFALELHAVARAVSDSETSETIEPRKFDRLESRVADGHRWRLASLEPETVFVSSDSFDQRFASASEWVSERRIAATEQRADGVMWPSTELGAPVVAGGDQPLRSFTPVPGFATAGGSKRKIRVAVASESLSSAPDADDSKRKLRVAVASESLSSTPDADDHTAIYDIAAHVVYLPNGQRLEAHSGLGGRLDDPRYVSEKDRGPTPPNVYDLSLREDLFHGVRAIRLNPVGGGNIFGRDGIPAHTYMLGPNGQSNGCVSFRDYPAFLNAFLSGEVNRLVVVEHLANTPPPKTASGWLPDTIKALFGRS